MTLFKSKPNIESLLMKILSCNFKRIIIDLNTQIMIIDPGFAFKNEEFSVDEFGKSANLNFVIKPDSSITILNDGTQVNCDINKFMRLLETFPMVEEPSSTLNMIPIFKKFFSNENSINLKSIFKQTSPERDFVNNYIDISQGAYVELYNRMTLFAFHGVRLSFKYEGFVVRNAELKIDTYKNSTVYNIVFDNYTYIEAKPSENIKYKDYIDMLDRNYLDIIKIKIENDISKKMWINFDDMIKNINFIPSRKDSCDLMPASLLSEIFTGINLARKD